MGFMFFLWGTCSLVPHEINCLASRFHKSVFLCSMFPILCNVSYFPHEIKIPVPQKYWEDLVMDGSGSCVDPESFDRGGPTLTRFF